MKRSPCSMIAYVSTIVATILLLSGCNSNQRTQYINIAGKVVNRETGEWPNGYLVTLFLNDREIARDVTSAGEHYLSQEGITDGYFELFTENTYQTTRNEIDFSSVGKINWVVSIRTGNEGYELFDGTQVLRAWVGDLEPGKTYELPVSSKNQTFKLTVSTDEDAATTTTAVVAESESTLPRDDDAASTEAAFETQRGVTLVEDIAGVVEHLGGNQAVVYFYRNTRPAWIDRLVPNWTVDSMLFSLNGQRTVSIPDDTVARCIVSPGRYAVRMEPDITSFIPFGLNTNIESQFEVEGGEFMFVRGNWEGESSISINVHNDPDKLLNETDGFSLVYDEKCE